MIQATGDIYQAFTLVFLVILLTLLRTFVRFFKKSSGKFLLDAFCRSVIFLVIVALLYRHPVFETVLHKQQTVLRAGATTQEAMIIAGKDAVLEVNRVGAALLRVIDEMQSTSQIRPADAVRVNQIRSYLETGMVVYNLAVHEEMGLSEGAEWKEWTSPFKKLDRRMQRLLQAPPGKDLSSALVASLDLHKAVVSRQKVLQKKTQQARALAAHPEITGEVSIRVDQGLAATAVSTLRVAEISDRVMAKLEDITRELKRVGVAPRVRSTASAAAPPLSNSQGDRQRHAFDQLLGKIGGWIGGLPMMDSVRRSADQLYRELGAVRSLPGTFQEQMYAYAGDVFEAFGELHQARAFKKIREMMAAAHNVGDIIETRLLVMRGKTKILLENVAVGASLSVFGDDLYNTAFFILCALLRPRRLWNRRHSA